MATASVHIDIPLSLPLKAPEGKSNLSSKLSSLCLTRLSEWEGGKGDVSHRYVSCRAACCFVLPIAERVCTLLVQITSTFLVPPRNHLLRS